MRRLDYSKMAETERALEKANEKQEWTITADGQGLENPEREM